MPVFNFCVDYCTVLFNKLRKDCSSLTDVKFWKGMKKKNGNTAEAQHKKNSICGVMMMVTDFFDYVPSFKLTV